jgi:hypothetical protein
MDSFNKPKAHPNSKVIKEKPIHDIVLPFDVIHDDLPFGKILMLKDVDYNIQDPQ